MNSLFLTFLFLSIFSTLTFDFPRESSTYKINISPALSLTSASSSTISPQMELYKLISRYFDTTIKKITLDDGRVMKCRIPLLTSHDEPLPESQEPHNLTPEEAETLLIHLKDSCTRFRDHDFLWEFCHDKYIRQYDDEMTIHNAGKPKPELFFIGFHPSVRPEKFTWAITEMTGHYNPPREYHSLPIRQEIPSYKYIHTDGLIAHMMNVKSVSNYQENTLYFVRVYVLMEQVDEDTVVDLNGNSLGYYITENMTDSVRKVFGGREYIQMERFISRVLDAYTFLLQDEFPIDISTSRVEIYAYKKKKGKKVKQVGFTEVVKPRRKLSLYGDIIYGHNAFLSDALPYTPVLLSFDGDHLFSQTVIQVINDYAIRIDKIIEGDTHRELKKMILLGHGKEMKDIKWTSGKGKIINMKSIVLGKNTAFMQDFSKGDMLMLLERNFDDTWTEDVVEVLEVVNNFVMKMRYREKPFYEAVFWTSRYMIGKYADLKEYSANVTEKRRYHKDDSVSNINTAKPHSVVFVEYDEELKENEHLCNPAFSFPDPQSWLMTFEPTNIGAKANLMLHLSNDPCSTEGIELTFLDMKQVVVINSRDKSQFFQSHLLYVPEGIKRFNKETMWIVYEQSVLRVGIGSEISLENQLVSFNLPPETNLSYYTFNRQFSYNVKVKEIQVLSLPQITKETLLLMKSFLSEPDNGATYSEEYSKGTFCGAAGIDRQATVTYKCSKKGKFFDIEEIEEPSICMYHLIVGTSVLCAEDPSKVEEQGELARNINCFVPQYD